MDDRDDKIISSVSSRSVKLHLFEPSKRKIWTIVGKEKEHWLDPTIGFCSCSGYYFSKMSDNKKECYHLETVRLAEKKQKTELIKFNDNEFGDFLKGLISDL
jgi:predicted nucleic acid-binding Zn finger protein|tara:strand:+ start:2672 stop:2977 length:306 start_codon:yes stop_codon:yes gene_type:complete